MIRPVPTFVIDPISVTLKGGLARLDN